MAQRVKVGLIYSYDENWIGGTYYILNLIHALQTLEEKDKPEITIFTDNQERFEELKHITKYSYLKFENFNLRLNRFQTFSNRVSKKIFKRNIFNTSNLKNATVDVLYPSPLNINFFHKIKHIAWIPDFQEIHLPDLFSSEEIKNRYKSHQNVARNADYVVFSSEDAQKDFKNLFPKATCHTFVLKFAVTHPSIEQLSFKNIQYRYKLDRPYFFSPNQFWTHKNHIVIIEALKIAIEKRPELLIVFSGKEFDNRTSGHVEKLKNLVASYKLENNVCFLGFIPREDQLLILRNAIAIIQPSLFEGWSTVVEDTKAQGNSLILSDIDVHREQVKNNVTFFNPEQADELAEIIIQDKRGFKSKEILDYSAVVKTFAKDFMELVFKASTY
ncbi:hypothetical protein DCS32_01520 [Dokdonia sp. Dokd-P16]|uniref:glycosyltransferase family 4 protein n=1 Tax=Dokdonia sp. Dokd-P16 TaxID=2173169 RepID=UPI000D54A71D|nr:glycosyltransferase family 1 protein [Dokdonia sp. Dokd-P16]AWH72884.1 hypothetical protein DCS32_01520 [Dokdonia sp. Dokd-P16]